jgi:hypothetical protein
MYKVKMLIVLFVVLLCIAFSGCNAIKSTNDQQSSDIEATQTTSPDATESQAGTIATSALPTTPISTSETVQESESITSTTTIETTAKASLYSSYAWLDSFDKKTGLAKFDYAQMLFGHDKVEWLMKNKGMSEEDAENSEPPYVIVNENPRLREINMKSLEIWLIPDHSLYSCGIVDDDVDWYNLYQVTYDEFALVYSKFPEVMTDQRFYYITVNDSGIAVKIEEIFLS